VRADIASIRGVGVAAAPWMKTFIPLLISETACSALTALAFHLTLILILPS
jgi:hypothetical protein